jgi:hypothetical protein
MSASPAGLDEPVAMNLLSFSTWLALGDLTVPGLTPQESAALVLLAASLLVFRAFRERYLLIWTPGLSPPI